MGSETWCFLWMTGFDDSLGRQRRFAIIVGLPDVPRYGAERALLPPDGHEFVNKIRTFPEGYSKAMPSRRFVCSRTMKRGSSPRTRGPITTGVRGWARR